MTAGAAQRRSDDPAGVRDLRSDSHIRLQVLFLAALLGVLLVVGLAVRALLGGWAAVAYAVVALLLVSVAAARARAAQERARERARSASGRTCTCCTSTQHDPVEVI